MGSLYTRKDVLTHLSLRTRRDGPSGVVREGRQVQPTYQATFPPLTPADPVTVFISYSRTNERAVLPIERALTARGVRVLRDKPSLPAGAHNVGVLRGMIDHGCDAVLYFVTREFLASDFIWRHEVPQALARYRREPTFPIIPVVSRTPLGDLNDECADRGLQSLTEFNAHILRRLHPTVGDAQAISRRVLASALASRLSRASKDENLIRVCLRTFEYKPPAPSLHLDLNWSSLLPNDSNGAEVWRDELLPALRDVRDLIAIVRPGRAIEVWPKCRLPVGVALGSMFPVKGAVELRIADGRTESTDEDPLEESSQLMVTVNRMSSNDANAIVEVSVSRDVTPSVTRWREHFDIRPGWRIRCAPDTGASRDALTSHAQAGKWALVIGDVIRQLLDHELVTDVHLFVASSVEFAAILGQQLSVRQRVHVYHGDNDTGYRLSMTLQDGGA